MIQSKHSVLIADDHAVVRAGLCQFLGASDRIGEIDQASTGQQVMDLLRSKRYDLLILDINMPDRGGLDILKFVRSSFPDTRVLICSGFPERQYAVNVLKAGASGYLLKSLIRKDLLGAIRVVHSGRRHIPREVAEALAEHVTDDALSSREIAVLRHVATGNANKRIAQQLAISEETVKAHMKNIMNKLGANDRTHAVTIALKRGIIDI